MTDFLTAFGGIAGAIFLAELADKDAFLLITVSTRVRAHAAFLAGIAAFAITTALFVTLGSLLIVVVPVSWVHLAGGVVMIAYGLWEARALVGLREVEEQEARVERTGNSLRAFFALVAALVLLDIAGDATEVLTIVFVARYADPLLVFLGACTGLFSAAALETALGNRLGRVLTPERLRYVSAAVFLTLGVFIIAFSF
ncbi:MAG: TMEM165/GDT1 family protein [Nitrososphaerota archaeon]|nr:TMEM165/GDT1 family protein [Nitrososphaerota archaeon]MDG7023272.1 TMEM165/GDT1 family protein [Nitrososphaerota archaeon]